MGMTYGAVKPKRIFRGEIKVKKIALGSEIVWSGGNICTYQVSPGVTYQEEVEEGATCLVPQTFTPALSGWTFIGWRTDTAANGSVLGSLNMGEEPVTLYAVFRQTITLSYAGNGATSGSTAAQTGYRYYNNGNITNPSFTVKANGFARSGYVFIGWKSGSTAYAVGQSVTLTSNLTLTAQWYTAAATNFSYTGGIQSWTVPITGLYLLKAYGAAGSTNWNAGKGKGGYAYRYVQLTAGTTIYVVCGGCPGDRVATGGYNGGGNGKAPGSSGAQYCGYAGGGATHIATRSGTLQQLGNTNYVHIVAAGAGGAGGVKDSTYGYGGDGGGLTGGDAYSNASNYFIRTGKGGTQNRGGHGVDAAGNIVSSKSGSFGKGGDATNEPAIHGGGGGAGLYGGGAGDSYNGASGGGGGSSYIGSSTTVYKGTTYTNGTTAGQNSGNGSASVQLIAA